MKSLTPLQIAICITSGVGLMFALKIIYDAKTWKELRDDVDFGKELRGEE